MVIIVRLVHSVMYNIAENMALGISLVTGSAVNVVLIEAIFISNFPEGLASTHGMKANGRSKKSRSIAVIIGTISAVVGFAVLSKASPFAISVAISFAAGAILVMLAESRLRLIYSRISHTVVFWHKCILDSRLLLQLY